MRKRICSFIMVLAMILTVLPIRTQAASTPMLGFRWTGYDATTNQHYEDTTGTIESSLSVWPGGSPVTLYFVDENGVEKRLSASEVSSSSSILTIEEDHEVPEVIHLQYVGIGSATTDYTYNNTTYSIPVTVETPDVGFYSGNSVSGNTYLSSFTVTDSEDTFYLVAKDDLQLTKVTLGAWMEQLADVTLDSTGRFATIKVFGIAENMYYDLQWEAVNVNDSANTRSGYASIELSNAKSSLQYRYGNWNNGVPSPSDLFRLV